MANRPYQRLPGRSGWMFASATLWEAEDHLLLAQSYGVTETYRRFFFRDIQAMVVCQTRTGLITGIILGLVGAAFGAGAALAYASEPAAGLVLGVVAVGFFLGIAINAFFGPTCRCTLHTAVQTQALPSVNRMRHARKILDLVRVKVAAAQPEPAAP